MGLDMYLRGEDYIFGFSKEPKPSVVCSWLKENVEAPEAKSVTFDLGYWRKHPDLHGFIVENFAGGVDECQRIELSADNITSIIQAAEGDRLAHGTEGFFFGQSPQKDAKSETERECYQQQLDEDLQIFKRALAWLADQPDGIWRSVYYEASW